MKVRNLSDDEFESEVLSTAGDVLVDFGAEWCGPCRQQEPLLEKLAAERPELVVVKVDIERAPRTAVAYGVRGVPTLILFRDGAPAARRVGLQPAAALRALLDG